MAKKKAKKGSDVVAIDVTAKPSRRKAQAYDESNIKVLMGLEKVRRKPGMYLGERGDQMVWRAIKELVDNSVDEFYAGRNDAAELFIDTKNDLYIIADRAEGIPVGKNKETGKSTLDVVFTELHGGGKFDDKAYKNSAGTHGVGAACANAVAERLRVWTKRDGQWYYREYNKGEAVGNLKKVKSPDKEVMAKLNDKAAKYGSIICFETDQTICSADATNKRVKNKNPAKLPGKQVLQWSRMIALMNPGLHIYVNTSKGKKFHFFNKGDISAVVKKIMVDNELSGVAKPIVVQTETVDLTLQWTSYDDVNLFRSYVNCSPTRDHGKHYEGFTSALGRVLQKLKKDVKLKGKDNSFKTSDALYGMVGIVNFKMSEPEFSSQTKDRLTSHVNKDVEELLVPLIEEYFAKHKNLAKTVIQRAVAIAKGRDELKKVMKAVGDVRKNQRSMLPTQLTEAASAKPWERELFIVEGDSAGGTAKDARFPKYQEIFKLRGKLTNASRTDMVKLMKTQVIQNFLVAIGVDLKSLDVDGDDLSNLQFDTANLRVGNVMIMCDADSDGGHIAVLLMSAIQRLIPKLFDEGRVYIVKSPLYLTTHQNKRYFGMTLTEIRESLPPNAKPHITRAKGLGELNASALHVVAFDPATRTLIQVTPPADGDGMAYFQAITGSNSQARKELLGL